MPSFLVAHRDTSRGTAEWCPIKTVATSSEPKLTITTNDVPLHQPLEDSYESYVSQLDPRPGWFRECESES